MSEFRQLGPLSDWSMLAMVGGIVLIDVAILLAWELEDPLQHEKVDLWEEVRKYIEDLRSKSLNFTARNEFLLCTF